MNEITENELWKDITGYEGYKVSNFGKIVSFKRKEPRVLKAQKGTDGKLQVSLAGTDNKLHCERVAKIVAEAFVENPEHFRNIEFIDGDCTNCSASNLKWVFLTTNAKEQYQKKERAIRQFTLEGKYIQTWKSASEIKKSERFCNMKCLSAACLGKIKTANGFRWRYADEFPAEDLVIEKKSETKKIAKCSMKGELIEIFETAGEAEASLNRKNCIANITAACRGSRRQAYGFKWKYV